MQGPAVIAPERVPKAAACLLKFDDAAFTLGRPVLPVLLRYPHRRSNPAFTGCGSLPMHLWRLFSQASTSRATWIVL